MSRIYMFELRRLLASRLFLGILLVLLAYGWLTLSGSIVLGIADTAPFSPWSFGYYMGQMLPLICLGEMLLAAVYVSPQQLRATPILRSTPVNQAKYAAVRGAAVLTGACLLSLGAVILGIGFLMALFGEQAYMDLWLPSLLVLAAPIALALGVAAALVGTRNRLLMYAGTGVIVLWAALPVPASWSLSLCAFFAEYPLTMAALDPALVVPGPILASRLILTISGILLAVLAICAPGRHRALPLRVPA